MDARLHETTGGILVERVRHVRLESRLPTPPILELLFYAFALVIGIGVGSVATNLAHLMA